MAKLKILQRLAVLSGGTSAEREISLVSGATYTEVLKELGHCVEVFDPQEATWMEKLRAFSPEIVVNALHGTPGEDGSFQGILEHFQIPYTHSGVLASALAMNKIVSKRLFQEAHIPTPEAKASTWAELLEGDPFPRPFVLKPVCEGSSVGVFIVTPSVDVSEIRKSWNFGEPFLLERYIPGKELAVSVLGNRALGVMEIIPQRAFYDYETKYTDGLAEHVIDAQLPQTIKQRVMELSVAAHNTLGCRGATRVDVRYNPSVPSLQGIFVLEVNTQPGMTPLSLLPEQARHAGISLQELIQWTVDQARCDR